MGLPTWTSHNSFDRINKIYMICFTKKYKNIRNKILNKKNKQQQKHEQHSKTKYPLSSL